MTSQRSVEKPYPGLRPFQKHEWSIFFGREPMIDAVLDRLSANQLVVVHGSSGCGKSSLIRAGVLPCLEQEHSRYGVQWRTAEMRPGSSPLWNLALALARLVEKLETDDEPTLKTTRTIRRLLNSGRSALSRIQEEFELGKEERVCILFDQFEELFRYARVIGREEGEALIEVLLGFEPGQEDSRGVTPQGIYAILTMRSDHLGDCGHFEGFAELVNASQYLLPRMGDEALLRAIREPARSFGAEVSSDLAVRLIQENHAEADALPLIQHGLMRLWQLAIIAMNEAPQSGSQSNEGCAHHLVLTADNYVGLERLLSEHAEEMLTEVVAKNRAGKKVTEYLFRAITEIDAEGRGIRRPERISNLVGLTGGDEVALEWVLYRFLQSDCGFLHRSSDDDPMIDIGHEALIRCWKRLDDPRIDGLTGHPNGWLQREHEAGQLWRATLHAIEHDLPKRARFFRKAWKRDIRSLLEPRLQWFNDLPSGGNWADRYGNRWDLVENAMKLTEKLKRSRKFFFWLTLAVIISVYAVIGFTLIFAEEFSWIEDSLVFFWLMTLLPYLLLLAYIVNHARLRRRFNRLRTKV